MLTGDKVETATCIATSSNLFARNAQVFHITGPFSFVFVYFCHLHCHQFHLQPLCAQRPGGPHYWSSLRCSTLLNLFARNAQVFHITAATKEQAEEQFQRFQKKAGACLVIDGRALALCTNNFPSQFIEAAMRCPAVVCCRCAPTHADVC
jgi:magnesium-transporting ATPase (P-type)